LKAGSPVSNSLTGVVVIAQLAEELDRTTLELALRIVPVEWWGARLGTTVPADPRAVVLPTTPT
jgi:hypothetical protein